MSKPKSMQFKFKSFAYRILSDRASKLGLICGILGISFLIIIPWIEQKIIVSQTKLAEGSSIFKLWKELPFPLCSKYYIFNITNPEQFLRGEVMQVREIGPFVFEQWRSKTNIKWSNKTVKYYEQKIYREIPERSADWNQPLIIINPIVATVGSLIKDKITTSVPILSPFLFTLTSVVLSLHSESILIRITPRQLLQGYKVSLLETAEIMLKPLALIGIQAKDIIQSEDLPNNAFGLLNGKNSTPIGPWEIYTGKDMPKKDYTQVISFKNQRSLNKWLSGECNRLNGTDGGQFEPGIDRNAKLTIFAADICRKITLACSGEESFHGIPVLKYKIAPEEWMPPSRNRKNTCYCVHQKRPDRCEYPGIMDVAGCLNGPFVITLPHFLGVSYPVTSRIRGLQPESSKHDFYLLIKSQLGIPIDVKARLQLNVRVERIPFLRGFGAILDTIVPLAWFEDSLELDDSMFNLLRIGFVWLPMFFMILFGSFLVVGFGLFFLRMIQIIPNCQVDTIDSSNSNGLDAGLKHDMMSEKSIFSQLASELNNNNAMNRRQREKIKTKIGIQQQNKLL
ncbi:lysosome membrane protein 2-like [Brevipalpus obovatus]|uniref:lysosome membrane protein 2-like n=1 Tax=Brevipalpus obovatus TaxID=246614 RepID=UPI003D9E220C